MNMCSTGILLVHISTYITPQRKRENTFEIFENCSFLRVNETVYMLENSKVFVYIHITQQKRQANRILHLTFNYLVYFKRISYIYKHLK